MYVSCISIHIHTYIHTYTRGCSQAAKPPVSTPFPLPSTASPLPPVSLAPTRPTPLPLPPPSSSIGSPATRQRCGMYPHAPVNKTKKINKNQTDRQGRGLRYVSARACGEKFWRVRALCEFYVLISLRHRRFSEFSSYRISTRAGGHKDSGVLTARLGVLPCHTFLHVG